MVKISCPACSGCGNCCRGMGDTIRLDPLDVHELCFYEGRPFEELLNERFELGSEKGFITPHLKMDEVRNCCTYLNGEGCCEVHDFRPGLCRLFPLGRNYSRGSFQYFIVEGGCDQPGKSKVRIDKWIGVHDLPRYEKFISDWHHFMRDIQAFIQCLQTPELRRKVSVFILQTFYLAPYDRSQDFYEIFNARLKQARRLLKK